MTEARIIPRSTAADVETRALVVATGTFPIAAVSGVVVVAVLGLEHDGLGSLATLTGIVSAVIAIAVFATGYLRSGATSSGAPLRRGRLLDLTALAVAHGALCLLGFGLVFALLQQAFVDVSLSPIPAGVVVGAACATSSYFVYLSAVRVSSVRVVTTMSALFVIGLGTSMLTTSDPHWWMRNLSILGVHDDLSSWIFNLMLVATGLVLMSLAGHLSADLLAGGLTRTDTATTDAKARSRTRYVGFLILLMGVLLACVGIFPTSEYFVLHNSVATGFTLAFGGIVFRVPWVVPGLPRSFSITGFAFSGIMLAAVAAFFVGFFTLTELEAIAFALILSWLYVFARMVDAAARDAAADYSSTVSSTARFAARPSPDERPVRRRPIQGSTNSR
ncbi:MAG: hypothetical protein ABWX82_01005 [Leifsonia sp.]